MNKLTRLIAAGDALVTPLLAHGRHADIVAEWHAAAAAFAAKPAAPSAPSERGAAFAKWFAAQVPGLSTSTAMLGKWAKCYDALIALDGKTEKEIAAVCVFARSHEFYRKVVLSPLKLRQTDSAGVRWFERLAHAMQLAKPSTPVQKIQGRVL